MVQMAPEDLRELQAWLVLKAHEALTVQWVTRV